MLLFRFLIPLFLFTWSRFDPMVHFIQTLAQSLDSTRRMLQLCEEVNWINLKLTYLDDNVDDNDDDRRRRQRRVNASGTSVSQLFLKIVQHKHSFCCACVCVYCSLHTVPSLYTRIHKFLIIIMKTAHSTSSPHTEYKIRISCAI